MGMLNAKARQRTPQQQQASAFATAPAFTQRMAATGQLQSGQPQAQQADPSMMPGHSQPWRLLGDADGGAMTAAQFPFLQAQVLSALQQYPQKKRSHTLGSGRT